MGSVPSTARGSEVCVQCGNDRKPACDRSPDCEHHCCGPEHDEVEDLYCAMALGWDLNFRPGVRVPRDSVRIVQSSPSVETAIYVSARETESPTVYGDSRRPSP